MICRFQNETNLVHRCPKNMMRVGNHRNSRMHIHQVYDLQRDGRCKHVARNEDRDFAGSRSLEIAGSADFDQFFFVLCVFFLVGEVLFLKCLSVFWGWLNKNLFFGLMILGISTAQKNFSCLMILGSTGFPGKTRVVHIFWGTGAHVSSCVFGNVLRGCW